MTVVGDQSYNIVKNIVFLIVRDIPSAGEITDQLKWHAALCSAVWSLLGWVWLNIADHCRNTSVNERVCMCVFSSYLFQQSLTVAVHIAFNDFFCFGNVILLRQRKNIFTCGRKQQNRILCHHLGDLGVTYTEYLWLIWKRMLDFLLVLIELFMLAFMVEVLRMNIGWNCGVRKGVGHV